MEKGDTGLPPEPLDKKWYGRFSEIAAFETYSLLATKFDERQEQKTLFIEGQIENPVFKYFKLDPKQLEVTIASLLELKHSILHEEPNDVVKQAYRWRINEKIAELFLLKCSAKGDMKNFKRWSEFVYGKPSREIFDHTINKIKSKIQSGLNSEDPVIRSAAQDLQNELEGLGVDQQAIAMPSVKTFAAARRQTLTEFHDVIDIGIGDPNITFNSTQIKEYFENALMALNIDGWVVEITGDGSSINVSQEEKAVKIPVSRQLTLKGINELILHEIGTHTLRRVKGERSRLMLLGLGLDRNLKGEEGIAVMRQQIFDDEVKDYAFLAGHLAISLAYGYAGQPMDFRNTFNFLEKYYYLKSILKGKKAEEAKVSARDKAWNVAYRTFRGTDCKTLGVCLTLDMVYREGNIAVWDVIENNPDEMRKFSIGKYDPSNIRHLWILEQLGITDEDLGSEI